RDICGCPRSLRRREDPEKKPDNTLSDSSNTWRETPKARPGSATPVIASTNDGARQSAVNKKAIDTAPTRRTSPQTPAKLSRGQTRPAQARPERSPPTRHPPAACRQIAEPQPSELRSPPWLLLSRRID